MVKSEIIREAAKRCGFNIEHTEQIFNTFADITVEELSKGNSVSFCGIFTAELKHHEAREHHNPITGKKFSKPERNVVKIKTGSRLKKIGK
jgi:nucleoid DNA-binding protein